MRIGSGYDVHRLVTGRKLILGGVTIPFAKGLSGHSDADVLVHALCDALLGAAGLGDIGLHFPDNDSAYKDISSLILLDRTREMLAQKNYAIINIDTIIFAQAPKLTPFRKEMSINLAQTLAISSALINIKATTTEGLGMIGQGQGIAALASVLINKN